jgi:hypothetical protein
LTDDWVEIREATNVVGHFGGQIPDVPVAEGVDVEALKADDPDPMFVTLEIATVGAVSQNRVLYDADLVESIRAQIVEKRPEALMGHLPGDQQHKYPIDDDPKDGTPAFAGHWIGAKMVGDTLYGKAYIPPGKVKTHFTRLKKVRGRLGTSIFGLGKQKIVDGVIRINPLKLETLDFAPPDRASYQGKRLGGRFAVTAETRQNEEDRDMSDQVISRKDVIAELTVSDIPEGLMKQIAESLQVQTDAKRVGELESEVTEIRKDASLVAEMRTVLEMGEGGDVIAQVREMRETLHAVREVLGKNADLPKRVREMHDRIQEMEQKAFEHDLEGVVAEVMGEWNVSDDEDKKKIDNLHKRFQKEVLAGLNGERDLKKVAEQAKKVWESDFEWIAETLRDSLAGPGAIVGGHQRGSAWKPMSADEAKERVGW